MNMWAPDIKTVKYVSVETSINKNYSDTINEFLGEDYSEGVFEGEMEYYDGYYDEYINNSTYYYRTVFDESSICL